MNKPVVENNGWFATIKEIAFLLSIVFLIRTFGFGLYQVPSESMETTMLVGERFFSDKFTYLFSSPQRNDIIAMNVPTFDYSTNPFINVYQRYIGWPYAVENWTKRVIGVPGDHVQGMIEDGKPVVYVNGIKLDEPYLNTYPILAIACSDGSGVTFRSYDPLRTDDDQPFYRVDPQLALTSSMQGALGQGYALTTKNRLVREPGKPSVSYKSRSVNRQGKSYWTGTDVFDVTLGQNQYWGMGDNRRGSFDSRCFGPVDKKLIHGRIRYRIWSIDSNESWWIVDLIKHPIDFWNRLRWDRFFQRLS
jgi:signal peptidase I